MFEGDSICAMILDSGVISMNSELLSNIRRELVQQADQKTRDSAQSYFKEPIEVYGVKTAIVNRIAGNYWQGVKLFGKQAIFDLCEELLKSNFNEEAFIACDWAYRVRDQYCADDLSVFADWIGKYIDNWAKCDTLCNHAVGALIDKYPELIEELKHWATSENRWLRRAAAVSLIIPARRGRFLHDIFEIATLLLTDQDDLVRKGYGWMLKEASKSHLSEVFDYIIRNKESMPRTALRYAIEKMPVEMRHQAMEN